MSAGYSFPVSFTVYCALHNGIYLPVCIFFLVESFHIFWNFSDELGSLWAVE